MSNKYEKTVTACCVGYIVQAVVNNLFPLLFVYFNEQYKIPLYLISIITAYNFGLQILVDSASASVVLKLGYRKTAILSAALAGLGLAVGGLTPYVFKGYASIYAGIMTAVTLMAVGGGVMEVILSPLIEALPVENKAAKMSFLHSFYCVGHILVVLAATGFFNVFGIEKWTICSFALIIVPVIDVILFLKCPIVSPEGDEKPVGRGKLFTNKTFVLFFILMFAAGAAEQAIAQWISYFAEKGLSINKSAGDLVGGCAFAFGMFLSRILFGTVGKKRGFNIRKSVVICGVCLTACYVLAVFSPLAELSLVALGAGGFFVGIMWPGIYSIAGETFHSGGTVMFSMLALGGDVGCTAGPSLVGLISSAADIKTGLLFAAAFPMIITVGAIILIGKEKNGGLNKEL